MPTMLTMWNEFIDTELPALSKIISERPIIAIMRVKVVSYNGISLSTRSTSSFIIKPDNSEAKKLQSWLTENDDKLADLLTSKYFLTLTCHKNDSMDDIIQISSLQSLPDNTTFTLRCELSITDVHQLSLQHIWKTSHATFVSVKTCMAHQVKDSTGTIMASLFGEDAEQLMLCDVVTFMKMEKTEQIGSLIRTQTDGLITAHVRATNTEYKGETKRRFNISFVHASNEDSNRLTPSNLEDRLLKHDKADKEKGKLMVIGYGTTNEKSL